MLRKSSSFIFLAFLFAIIIVLPRVTDASFSPTNASAPTPSQVLVVYNSNITTDSDTGICGSTQESLCLAQYYANARGIPSSNILGIAAPTASGSDEEQISATDYSTSIQPALQTYLSSVATGTIRDIVLMKGMPLKINSGLGKSVDSVIAQFYSTPNYSTASANPYLGADSLFGGRYRFVSSTMPGALNFIVTRLDGQTVADVKAMVDRSLAADTSGQKYFVIDDSQNDTYGRQSSRDQAIATLNSLGYKTIFDQTSAILTTSSILASSSGTTLPMIAYSSDGVHASTVPMSGNIYNNEIANNGLYANGAIANTFESFSGVTVTGSSTSPTSNCGGQNCISDFIHAGGSGGYGEVYEPYSGAIPHEEYWMPAYARGYTWGEAAYMGMSNLSWQTIVLGDPLMTINASPFYGVPNPPTNVTAVPGNGFATVSFATSTSFNPPVTSYIVTSSPGNIIATGTSSPIVVSGLTNGTPYTFSIVAQSAAGTSTATTSSAVTPFVTTYPLTLTSASGGSISASPSLAQYASGTLVTLLASPNTGYYFAGFTGGFMSSSTPFQFVMTATTTERANFSHTAFPLATISSIGSSASDTSAVISWTTSEVGSSMVNYGLDTSYASSTVATDTAPEVLLHSVSLSGLLSCSTYHFNVDSINMSNGVSTSSDQTFTTYCPASAPIVAGAAASSGGGGGGGGGEAYAPYVPPTPAVSTTEATSSATTPPLPAPPDQATLYPPSAALLKNFGRGTESADVLVLRKFLFSNGYQVGTSSLLFDSDLEAAVATFQQDHAEAILAPSGLTSGTGYVGAETRAFINALIDPSAVSTEAPSGTSAAYITSYLLRGSQGSQVTLLQQFLSSRLGIPQTTIVTGYFGPITENAVEQFQASNGISQTGTVGPLTRAAINALQ